ncbi:hypothetical protein [Vibrio sp.]|uniref:hypothetical protein n=1 Tax=Vibrio sp. TaxID=678 RepID=UPI003AA7FCD0
MWCGLLALKQTDLKLVLAYSTNVALVSSFCYWNGNGLALIHFVHTGAFVL